MQTKQNTKAKPATKSAAKQTPKTMFYASILGEALAGKFGAEIQRFYVNAIQYHKKQGTKFPRARNASEKLLSPDETRAFLAKHAQTSIPAGSKIAQRVFDQMMVETSAK